jgi:hypothetical protein
MGESRENLNIFQLKGIKFVTSGIEALNTNRCTSIKRPMLSQALETS